MQPEQQQRIMGYFIEEAKDHLNTIEQGLLNLQSTIEDPEMVNELFRAAHSVKGGAAMLGLNSIQHVSHRMEDFFKILKESQVTVDQKLESLFLRTFDALQELLEQLQGPFGLTDETASATVAAVEPTFVELEQHLNSLVLTTGGAQRLSSGFFSESDLQAVPVSLSQVDGALAQSFGSEVPVQLREMLRLFKQSEFGADSRQQLQEICRSLTQIGQQFDLYAWCQLVETARQAIANPDNSYRVLAPVVIQGHQTGTGFGVIGSIN
ncbi:Hpt domain-containing protein [Kovacikia minuta CCNUW1]|uniref:Hpt domain-containing protein n=1 Tax=Kovacikia minuta TaxID=2931930 RepID=UPI001CCE5168|nr:Hpt domain-containing protein [Kovacikia minuta]UBF26951.1 Hpt domain-containing protein [Kovacikia minuta CCNUW1]